MNRPPAKLIANLIASTAFLCLFLAAAAVADVSSPFAGEIVAGGTYGSFGGWVYGDPNAALGKPTPVFQNDPFEPNLPATARTKLVEAAYYLDTDDEPVVVTITDGSQLTVKFDHLVVDHPGNFFGVDLMVFGNSFFDSVGDDNIDDATDMNAQAISGSGYVNAERVLVSVSSDGTNWYAYDSGPWGDDFYPTQGYRWDDANACWTDEEMDFTRPVNPALGPADFDGITAAAAIDLYNGSGGGAGIDISEATGLQTTPVSVNGNTVDLKYIQYVRLNYLDGSGIAGEIDALSDASVTINGDTDFDADVDLSDLTVMGGNYGATSGASWATGDFNADGEVNLTDLTLLGSSYGQSLDDPPAAAAGPAVPEPASLTALALAALVAGRRRRG
jgi:hypothetical protein